MYITLWGTKNVLRVASKLEVGVDLLCVYGQANLLRATTGDRKRPRHVASHRLLAPGTSPTVLSIDPL